MIPPEVLKVILDGGFAALSKSLAYLRASGALSDEEWSAILAELREWLDATLALPCGTSTAGTMLGIPLADGVSAEALPAVCALVADQSHRLGLTKESTLAAIDLDQAATAAIMAQLGA